MNGHLNEITLLKAKLTVPRVREDLVERPRLLMELDRCADGRLTVVCAPAGYGKTTLLSQWAQGAGRRAAWVALDELDNDPVRFWRYIAAALAGAAPGEAGSRIGSLAGMLPHASLYTFVDGLMNEWHNLPEQAVLILDDYHVLTDPCIHDSLAYAIQYLPEQGHLIIGTRSDLPFSTGRWLGRGEMHVLSLAKLQFSEEETASFYAKTHRLRLTPERIHTLHKRSEGWITGLHLAAVSHSAAPDRGPMIEPPGGSHRAVADYLFEEVFSALSEELQRFLLYTSVLERIDAGLSRVVSREADSDRILNRLEADNLFILPIDVLGSWYRYHPLFAEFLRTMLRRTDPDGLRQAHRLASGACAARGMFDDAIDHALTAEDYGAAMQLLEHHMEEILRQGEFTNALRWLEKMPSDSVASSEWLILHAFVLTVSGRTTRAEQLVHTIKDRLDTETDQDKQAYIASGLFFIRSNLLFFSGSYEEWQTYADNLDEDFLIDDGIFYSYNFNISEPLINRTRIGLKGALSPEAEVVGLRFSQVLETHGWRHSLFNLYVRLSLAEGYYEWNRIADCQRLLDQIGAYDELAATPGLFVPHRILQTRLYILSRQWELAHAWIGDALLAAAAYPDPRWLSALSAFKARLHLARDELGKARQEVSQLQLSAHAMPTLSREIEILTLVRLLGRRHKHSQALRLLERLLPQAQREGIVSSIIEIGVQQALLEHQRGQRKLALQRLSEVLPTAHANRYIRSFLDEGEPLAQLLQTYMHSIEDSGSGSRPELETYVRELLTMLRPEDPAPAQTSAEDQLPEPLTESELGMLSLIRSGASNKQIAAALALSEGTVRVYLSRLYGKLGVSSRTQALQAAQEMGLLQ
ncbi:LuxR C-terminal-related transcriptional regulator [Paenibacillus sp. 1P07SE]|uniref:LuxR C-terminal-related transcriptional regulator n=1 Tax=Paenibacillus sp. 1P07SE TaxID=3132209 RepID=UPI0039A452BD